MTDVTDTDIFLSGSAGVINGEKNAFNVLASAVVALMTTGKACNGLTLFDGETIGRLNLNRSSERNSFL
jgi:hypothetical protein